MAAVVACMPSAAAAKAVKVTSLPVAFQVKNTNTTAAPGCTPDGATYTVRGHLTAPAKGKRSGVTLYLHGLGLGEWLWNFQQVKSYNFVAGMARLGHASVSVDRLGYGASDKPPRGKSVCIGSQADVAHQIVGQLKTGSFTVQGAKARKFKRVGLVGHSAAGQISITEAYTYLDLRALVVIGFSFSNLPRGNDEFGFQRIACDAGGDPIAGLQNYGFFGPHRGGLPQHDVPQCAEGGSRRRGQAALPRPLWRQLLPDRHDPETGRDGKAEDARARRLRPAGRAVCAVRVRGPGRALREGPHADP